MKERTWEGRCRKTVVLAVCTGLLAACALPQHQEDRYFAVGGANAVHATRYENDPQHRVHRLWIDLRRAPAFGLRLPDGAWVSSRALGPQTLAQHGMTVEHSGTQRSAVWHPAFSAGSLTGRHQYLRVVFDETPGAATLELGACGWSFDAVLRTADGAQTFGFPIPVEALAPLFGAPSRIQRTALLTGHSCF